MELARTRPLIDELRAVGRADGASVSQVAPAWLVQFYGDTVVAIPGASKPRQAEGGAAVVNGRPELDAPFMTSSPVQGHEQA